MVNSSFRWSNSATGGRPFGIRRLTQASDGVTAQQEADHLESEGYDDLQEAVEERDWPETEQGTAIEVELARLSEEQLAHVAQFIQELLDGERE
jgi:hypothetical protein